MNGPPPHTNAAKRVLVVDDDDIFRRFVVTVLRWRGYDVMEASRGVEALALFEEHGADLVLCDVYMPGLNGLKTVEQLVTCPVPPRIIIMSGAQDRDATLQGAALRYGYVRTLDKPFDVEELLESVADAIGFCE